MPEPDKSDLTLEEQVAMISNTDNSLKPEDLEVDQPPQDPDWQPDPDEVIESI